MNSELVTYKNFKINRELIPLIRYMDMVEESREQLHDISKNWDSLSLLSQLGDAGMNMNTIKNNFTHLSSRLINHLADEVLKKSVQEMQSKAQVAVDIVIRNLFERTADIGFLATDTRLRDFLTQNHTRYSEKYSENLRELKSDVFAEYIEKYSVYFDIVLMNTNGDILANIDENNTLLKSSDPVIKQVLETSEDYIETYKKHDFLPYGEDTLVYSYRVTRTNDHDSEILGVLCLCFKFEDEMKEVFRNLVNRKTKECITLLNSQGSVIATSDKYHVPNGAELEIIMRESYKIISFGGRDYIATSCKTNGYQGFYGLGWYGHIMVPLEHAFQDIIDDNYTVSQELLLAILQHGDQFSQELKSIPTQATSIQHNLNRAIWNGNVKQSNSKNNNKQFSRSLLQEIRTTGENTKEIIASSIASLTKTMVLGDSAFLADLIVDIMDRNLYERANDCRWWALTTDFRKVLDNPAPNAFDREKVSDILKYINNLYTVYTNLFVYDKSGVVIAVSNDSEEHLVGRKLSFDWVNRTLSNSDSSKYYVSDFEKSNLYDGKHTYIYSASIKSYENEENVVGGIGIVFDSELQFEAMINESLPKEVDGSIKEGMFAVLTTKNQEVIASNNRDLYTGDFFDVSSKFYELDEGESTSEIIEYNGKYYALGAKCSKGYREYKSVNDEYSNKVYSFVLSYISDISETIIEERAKFSLEKDISTDIDENSVDIASFMIGNQWIGVDAREVLEAITIDELHTTIKMDDDHHFKGTIMYKDSFVSVIDIKNFIKEVNSKPYEEIIILRFGKDDSYIGILVHSLSDIPEVHIDRIKPLQEYIVGNGTLAKSVVFPAKDSKSKDVLTILSIDKINQELVEPEETKMLTNIRSY